MMSINIIKKTCTSLGFHTQIIKKCIQCDKTEEQMMGEITNKEYIFSVENLCINCEILKFPERFHGCGFCKRPIREKFSCSICSNGFVLWIKDVINPLDPLSICLRNSAYALVEKSIHSDEIKHMNQHKFIMRTTDGYYKWPGFYAGITDKYSLESNFFPVWIIPRLTKKYNYKKIKYNLKIFQQILLDILLTNNIHLYDDIQINPNNISQDQIYQINPYDTRLIKLEKII